MFDFRTKHNLISNEDCIEIYFCFSCNLCSVRSVILHNAVEGMKEAKTGVRSSQINLQSRFSCLKYIFFKMYVSAVTFYFFKERI